MPKIKFSSSQLEQYSNSIIYASYKILRVMCMGEDITKYLDDKVKLFLILLGHNISGDEILENVEK